MWVHRLIILCTGCKGSRSIHSILFKINFILISSFQTEIRMSYQASSDLGKSAYSTSLHKEVLWNVVEPGDHYDIRRSMIARMPGTEQNWLGNNLEVLCLFQAAQIERLCEFLDEYKFRYRELERRELDRHSYEIQIKQLTQQLVSESNFKSENSKLKEFIRKQTIQIQQVKSKQKVTDPNLQDSYQSALQQISNFLDSQRNYKTEINNLNSEINSYKARLQVIEKSKNQEIQQLRQQTHKLDSDRIYSIENQINSLKQRHQNEMKSQEFEIQRLKESNESKNAEIIQFSKQNKLLVAELDKLELIIHELESAHPQQQHHAQLENRIALMGQEIERLNMILRQSTSKLDEALRNEMLSQEKSIRIETEFQDLSSKYTQLQLAYNDISNRYEEENRKVERLNAQIASAQADSGHDAESLRREYQFKIDTLEAELKRIEDEKYKQSQQFYALKTKYTDLEYSYNKVSVLETENQSLKAIEQDNKRNKAKIAEYENKIALLSHQIERLTSILSSRKLTEADNYQQLQQDYDQFRRSSIENQHRITQQYESQMQRRVQEYESRLQKNVENAGSEFERRLHMTSMELERLNTYLREKTEQSETNKKKIKELESAINDKYEIEFMRKTNEYENMIRELKWENDQLNRRVRESEYQSQKLPESENRLAMEMQKVARLNESLSMKNEEVDRLKKQYREMEIRVKTDASDLNQRNLHYEETISHLRRQNQDLHRKLQELVDLNRRLAEYENRTAIMNQEIDRQNHAIKDKVEALNQAQNTIFNLTQEIDKLKRARDNTEHQLIEKMEYERMEISRKVASSEQNMMTLRIENEELNRRLNQLNRENVSKLNHSVQQIENLSQNIRQKTNELSQAENTIRNLSHENEQLRRDLRELQINQANMSQKMQVQTSRAITMYEQNLSNTNRELSDLKMRSQAQVDDLNRKLSEYESRLMQMSKQNERLNGHIQTHGQENEKLRRNINQLQMTITQKYEVEASRKISESQSINQRLRQELEEFRRRAQENQQRSQRLQNQLRQIQHAVTNKYEIEANQKYSVYEQNIKMLTSENQELRFQLQRYQQNLQNLNRNIEQLHRKNDGLEQQYRNLSQQSDLVRRQTKQNEQSLSKQFEYQHNQIKNQYESTIANVGRQNQELRRRVSEGENRMVLLSQELERVNHNLRNRTEEYQVKLRKMSQELEFSKRSIHELQANSQYSAKQLETELTHKITVYQTNLKNITRSYQQLKTQHSLKLNESHMMKQQIERLNQALRDKMSENSQIQIRMRNMGQDLEMELRRFKEQEKSMVQRTNSDFSRKMQTLEEKIALINRQYDEYRRETGRKLSQSENNIQAMSQEIERLNSALISKVEELAILERNLLPRLKEQNQGLRRKIIDNQNSYSQKYQLEVRSRASTYENNIQSLQSERDRATRKIEELQHKIAENENRFALLSQEIERLNVVLKQKIEQANHFQKQSLNLTAEIDKLRNSMSSHYGTQIDKLNSMLKTRTDEYQALHNKYVQLSGNRSEFEKLESAYNLLTQEYHGSKKQLNEYEISVKKLYMQFERLQVIINQLKVERQSLFEKNQGLSYQVDRLTQQNQAQETESYELRLKLSDQISLEKRINQYMALMVILFAEIETLRKRIFDKDNEVREVRRSSLAPLKVHGLT